MTSPTPTGDAATPTRSPLAGASSTRPPWTIGADLAVDRVLTSVQREHRLHLGEPLPSPRQVAMVLHALADHSALVQAVNHRPDASGGPATSVGRWLHDLADEIDGSTR